MANYIILKVTNDKYEFVVDMFDTNEELHKKTGIKLNTIKQYFYRGSKFIKNEPNFKFVRVNLLEDEEIEDDLNYGI